MKFFQKTGVAVAITVLAIAAALFIGLSPVLKSGAETAPVQTVSSQDTSAQASSASPPASESTASGTAGDETISNKYIRDEAGLFTRSAENTIKDYNDKIYSKTGSHVAILTTADTGGMSLESYTNSAFDAMGLSEYDMLFSVDTDTQTWYVTTGAYVADFADSRLESIFKDGFAAILDTDADEAAKDLYKDLYSWCKSNLTGAAGPADRLWKEKKRDRHHHHHSDHLLDPEGHLRLRPQRRWRRLLVRPVPRLAVFEPAPWSRPRPRPAARRVWRRSAPRRRAAPRDRCRLRRG